MSQPTRSVTVTVYHIRGSSRTRRGFAVRCKKVGAVSVASTGTLRERKSLAAAGWIKSVGVYRRDALIASGTPAADAEQETDLRAISAMIKPVPTWFTDEDAYVYDNISDAWLIVVPLEAPNPC